MIKRSNHVVPLASKWAVKKSGSSKASKIFSSRDSAIIYGRELSKSEKTDLYIHKKNGMIQNRNSFGNDLYPPKDKKQ
jgi:Uncharacterized protein conserved in bacteria (DUF2188)